MADSSGAEQARMAVKEISDKNIDELVRLSTFKDDVMEVVREHMSLELNAWYFYKKLAADARRADIALHGFATLFSRAAAEAYIDEVALENYLIQRGGCVAPKEIPAPKVEFPDEPIDPTKPVLEALKMEKNLLEHLHKVCAAADEAGDNALEDFIEDRFLKKETAYVKNWGDLLQQAVRVSKTPGHGLYHLDKEIRKCKGDFPWARENNPYNVDAIVAREAASL